MIKEGVYVVHKWCLTHNFFTIDSLGFLHMWLTEVGLDKFVTEVLVFSDSLGVSYDDVEV